MAKYWFETLGCPKNQVDSDRLMARLESSGFEEASDVVDADVVVVNTCAFIDAAREESIETILELSSMKSNSAKLVVTGCLAQRYYAELSESIPEIDIVARFGEDFTEAASLGKKIVRRSKVSINTESSALGPLPAMDLLRLPRRRSRAPWAYVKVAEGCNKNCGFCSIPSFRGRQVSKSIDEIRREVEELGIVEAVLVAQDLANYGIDIYGHPSLVKLYDTVSTMVPWVRLLYVYPTGLTDPLIERVASSSVPYFDLSLQHVSAPHLRRMRRVGSAKTVLGKIEKIRSLRPEAVFRTSFILGYPGETEEDQEVLKAFIEEAELDWVGFFPFSLEEGTFAAGLPGQVDRSLALERINELSEIQDRVTRVKRMSLIGKEITVLVEADGRARSFREAPEIDGVCFVGSSAVIGGFMTGRVGEINGVDLVVEADNKL